MGSDRYVDQRIHGDEMMVAMNSENLERTLVLRFSSTGKRFGAYGQFDRKGCICGRAGARDCPVYGHR